jgi:hypothetical protein
MVSTQTDAIFNLFAFIGAIISIIMIITFFIMASRLKKIENILDVLMQLELKKPENKRQIKCETCGKEYSISILKKGIFNSNKCHNAISLE